MPHDRSYTRLTKLEVDVLVVGTTLTAPGGAEVVAGDETVGGNLIFTAASAKIIPGVTSLLIQDTADANTNLGITDAGVVTIRAGLTVTAGGITVTSGNVVLTSGNLTLTSGSATASGSYAARSGTAVPAPTGAGAAFLSSSTALLGIWWVSSTPNTFLTAAKGSIAFATNGSSASTRAFINTDGSTGWTPVTTAT